MRCRSGRACCHRASLLLLCLDGPSLCLSWCQDVVLRFHTGNVHKHHDDDIRLPCRRVVFATDEYDIPRNITSFRTFNTIMDCFHETEVHLHDSEYCLSKVAVAAKQSPGIDDLVVGVNETMLTCKVSGDEKVQKRGCEALTKMTFDLLSMSLGFLILCGSDDDNFGNNVINVYAPELGAPAPGEEVGGLRGRVLDYHSWPKGKSGHGYSITVKYTTVMVTVTIAISIFKFNIYRYSKWS